jgi:uncharacterized membrane protein
MYILRLSVALLALVMLAANSADDDLAPMKASCVKTCLESNSDKAFCESFCKCTTVEMGRYQGKDLEAALQSEAKVNDIAGRCLGRHFSSYFLGNGCSDECAGDENCKNACSCIKGKLPSVGNEDQIATFLKGFAEDDPAVMKRMDAWKAECRGG